MRSNCGKGSIEWTKVVAASSGNHTLAVATIARKLDISFEIFLSRHVHPKIRSRIDALGARVLEVQGDALAAELAALGLVAVILVDPTLPPNARFGPVHGELLGQPATLALQPVASGRGEPALSAYAFNGGVTMIVDEPNGAIERLKSYGLPLLLIHAVCFSVLFELLRRLFRNAERSDSFTPQSVRLVQIVGGALIVFSLIATVGESWFAHAMYTYLSEHTQIAISGTSVRLPPAENMPLLGRFPLRSPVFFSGFLVLALAEVFRQGLALQRESDLAV